MPGDSLEKTIFLKRKLLESQRSIILPLKNARLNEKLTEFHAAFDAFITQIQNIKAEACLSETRTPADLDFLKTLQLNRGDKKRQRFLYGTRVKRAYFEDQISRLTKTFVETIEDEMLSPALVDAYRQHSIYQILYHHGVLAYDTRFDEDRNKSKQPPPPGPILIKFAIFGLGLATLSVAFFATVALLGLSGGWVIAATALFGSAIAYMAGLLYGIINDIFATKANLPYFLLGHQREQGCMFLSNDRFVQAIGWGIIAAQPIAGIASIVFGISISAVMAFAASPVLTFVLPILLVIVPLFAACANVYARYSANQYIKKGVSLQGFSEGNKKCCRDGLGLAANAEWIDLDKFDFDADVVRLLRWFNDFQCDGLALMSSSKKDKANWLANSDRNGLGYIGTPLLGITGLVLMLTLTTAPMVFFSPLLATIIPLVAAVIAIACLATALTYVSINQEKQIDNRYKLFKSTPDRKKKMDELYVPDELMGPVLEQEADPLPRIRSQNGTITLTA